MIKALIFADANTLRIVKDYSLEGGQVKNCFACNCGSHTILSLYFYDIAVKY